MSNFFQVKTPVFLLETPNTDCEQNSDCRLTEYCNDENTCQPKIDCPHVEDAMEGNCPCLPGDCGPDDYCSLDGRCYPIDTCEQHFDSFEGMCPFIATPCNDHADCTDGKEYCASGEIENADDGSLSTQQFCMPLEFCEMQGNAYDGSCPDVEFTPTSCSDHTDCTDGEQYCGDVEVENADDGSISTEQICMPLEMCTEENAFDGSCPE